MWNIKHIFVISVLVLAGCRVQIEVPEGGEVTTESGRYSCETGQTCIVDVVDLLFHENFIAQPENEKIFSGWKMKAFGFCGGSLSACELYTSIFSGNQALIDILASDATFFLEPTFIDSDSVRIYQVGDFVELSGTLTKAVSGSATVTSSVLARMEFLESPYSYADKNVVAVRTTITNVETDENLSSTVHLWQEPNGTFVDLNNEHGHYYVNSAESVNGVNAIAVPLTPFADVELQYYTASDSQGSDTITTGTRSLSTSEEQLISISLGSFSVYPVTRTDTYSFLVDYADYKRNASVTDEETLWISQAKGIVKKRNVERRYSNIGKLEVVVTLELEATRANF
ncbi:MAG: hypothetical protein V7696_12600 [Halioglobus sp.]